MTTQKILVLKTLLKCLPCGISFDGYIEVSDEGFCYAALLFECNKCRSVFSHSIEDEQYLGSLKNIITGKSCPKCKALLEESLQKVNIIGHCPSCGTCGTKGTEEVTEIYLETYQLYR